MIPSRAVMNAIGYRPQAARLLLQHATLPIDLKKIDRCEQILLNWGHTLQNDVFEMLVQALEKADKSENTNTESNKSILTSIGLDVLKSHVQMSDEDRVARILKTKWIQVDSIPSSQQVGMWQFIQSRSIAKKLKDYGFNPEVQDDEGNTALMRAVGVADFYLKKSGQATSHTDIIQVLLPFNTSKDLKNKAGHTVKDLATHPALKAIIG